MHTHHGALRLLVILLCIALVGAAIYLVLVYGLGRGSSYTATTTPAYFPTQGSTTTPVSVSTSTPPVTSTTTWEQGMTIVTTKDNFQTVHLSKNERFVIQLGSDLKWTLTFDPATGITRVPNSTTANGIQGIYEADQVGSITMHAAGAPVCKAGQACPMFLVEDTVTFVVK
jgi:hypothetical protein